MVAAVSVKMGNLAFLLPGILVEEEAKAATADC
jgi:hypothetical protein